MILPLLSLISLAAVCANASPRHVIARPNLHAGWSWIKPVSPEDRVTFTMVVKEQGRAEIMRIAAEVSDPTSKRYGAYLTQDEIDRVVAPTTADIATVTGWLQENGLSWSLRGVSNLLVHGTAQTVGQALRTELHHVKNTHTAQCSVLAAGYELPSDVGAAVGAVLGLIGLPLPPRDRSIKLEPQLYGGNVGDDATKDLPANVTPSVLWSTYRVAEHRGTGADTVRQAVVEFQGQYHNATDLTSMFAAYVDNYTKGVDDVVSKTVGKNDPKVPGVEAELDVQYMMGVSPGVKTEFWSYPGQDFGKDLNDWTSSLLAASDPPLVTSVSYGWQGNLSEIGIDNATVSAVETNFVKLAARGITVLISSGDSGSGYTQPQMCMPPFGQGTVGIEGKVDKIVENVERGECCFQASINRGGEAPAGWTFVPSAPDGPVDTSSSTTSPPPPPPSGRCTIYSTVTKRAQANSTTFSGFAPTPGVPLLFPSWPASSPWVTAVGATRFVGQKVGGEEQATDQFGSGGGFSSMFNQSNAQWQASATAAYLKVASGLPPAAAFPANGRATPDVSALGEGYQVYVADKVQSVGGTSASSPAFAGLVSLLNDVRAKAGKPAMGFLNPFLYQNPEAFFDVVKGNNKIGRGGEPLEYGYECAQGWDPATGLGTPMYDKLLEAAMHAV